MSTANQKRIFLSPPHLSGEELELVQKAFASNYIAPLGPMVNAFEEEFSEYTGIPYCLAVSSGTAAMHLALRDVLVRSGFGVPGSELGMQTSDGENAEGKANSGKNKKAKATPRPIVLASTLTFIGSVSPVVYENAEPVFIDCDRDSWNMDPALLEQALAKYEAQGTRPAAVIPTDLYGQCCNLPRIRSICAKYDVPVICDSAEAAGAWYREDNDTGTMGPDDKPGSGVVPPGNADFAEIPHEHSPKDGLRHAGYGAWASIYSFNGNKIITSSGGGMLASHDKELIEHARKLATQAREPAPHYEHTEIGFNYRMSNIVAAVGLGQLRVLDERTNQARRVCEGYRERLGKIPGINFMPEAPYNRCNRWLTVITVDAGEFGADGETVRLALEAEDIEARPLWKPMHMQPVFTGTRVVGGGISEDLFRTGLCLPSGTALTDSDLDRICEIITSTR